MPPVPGQVRGSLLSRSVRQEVLRVMFSMLGIRMQLLLPTQHLHEPMCGAMQLDALQNSLRQAAVVRLPMPVGVWRGMPTGEILSKLRIR